MWLATSAGLDILTQFAQPTVTLSLTDVAVQVLPGTDLGTVSAGCAAMARKGCAGGGVFVF